MNIVKEESGKTSSKRVAGLSCVGVALVMALIDQFTDFKVSYEVWVAIFGAGMGLLGLTAIPNKIVNIIAEGDTVDPTKPGGPKT